MNTLFHHGWLEVICGPMFSGKTEELIRRVRRSQIARQRVQIFKPSFDTRYAEDAVVSHSAQSMDSVAVEVAQHILEFTKDSTRVVAIDEVQFFGVDIIPVIEKLTTRGLRVIVAGLDLDYRGKTFGPMGDLLAMADEVHKIAAICTVCGAAATRSQRLSEGGSQFLLGAETMYEARCRGHFEYEPKEGHRPHSLGEETLHPQ
jgi:thymidine kinase